MVANFLDKIVRWYQLRSDGDVLFAKFMALQLFGNLLGKGSFVNIMPKPKKFNLYTALVGDSYFGRKNVTQDMFKSLYPAKRILPNESSAEKFLVNLSRMPNGVWMYGEISKILKHINKGGYLSTIVETLNDLHNYEHFEFVRDIMRETIIIKQPYPCFNTTITPTVLKEQVTTEMLEGGFFSKVILIPGKPGKPGNRKEIPEEAFRLEREIKELLKPLFEQTIAIKFKLTAEAYDRFSEIEKEAIKDSNVKSVAGRYAEDVVIIAALIAFGEGLEAYSLNSKKSINNKNNLNSNINNIKTNNDDFMVFYYKTIFTILTIKHLDEAYEMIKPCIKLVEELYEHASMHKKYIIKLKKYIENNHPVKRSEAMRMCNLDQDEATKAEQTLVSHAFLNYFVYQGKRSDGAPAKPQYTYCVMEPNEDKCKHCKYRSACHLGE